LVAVWTLDGEIMFNCMMKMLLALAYPFCCLLYVLWCGFFCCDDHQFDWWEQMGEVPEVSKEMEIPLHSPGGLVYMSVWVHLWLRPMYPFVLRFMYSG